MRRTNGNRARLGALVVAVAMGAAALLALPAIGSGHDHPRSDEAAGTIESFDPATGQLVVDLTKGDSISALITSRTHIRCGDEGRRRHGHHFGHHHGNGSASVSSREHGENEGREDDQPRGLGRDDFPDQDPAEDEDNRGNDDRGERCLDLLVPGTVVRGAVVILIDGDAFYKEVGLAPAPPSPTPSP